jgi:hypothetical protein
MAAVHRLMPDQHSRSHARKFSDTSMHPKIKSRPPGENTLASPVEPLVLHDVTQQTASANAASRQQLTAKQPASGSANHARHHVSRHTQS